MLIMNRSKTDNDIVKKYHIMQPTFDLDEVAKTKVAIIRKTVSITLSEHLMQRIKEKHISIHKLSTMLGKRTSRIFEIKLIEGRLYRFAVRVFGHFKDTIYVIEPKYINNEIHLLIVTAYKNDCNDCHTTINLKKYVDSK